jgi:hypothetical protein
MVPRGEVVFVPSLPQAVEGLNISVGSTASTTGPVASLGSGNVALVGQVDPVDAQSVKVGQIATATSDANGQTFQARVSVISSTGAANDSGFSGTGTSPTSGGQSGPPGDPIKLLPTNPIGSTFVGQNVGVQIETASSHTKTWIVPISAVVTTANGTSSITIVERSGRQRVIRVNPGLVAGGEESVSPIGADLALNDLVVVGSR